MIEINKEELLKDTIDYEDYSENVWKFTREELMEEGLLKCSGCCSHGNNKENKCSNCKGNGCCKNTKNKN